MANNIPADILEEAREQFNEFDRNGDGHINVNELGDVLAALGERPPGYKLREIIAEVDANKNNTIEFSEFLTIFSNLSTQIKSSKLKEVVSMKKNLKQGGTSHASAEGTVHSFSESETQAFADWINSVLDKDPDCKKYLPINPETNDLFEKVKDGILFCKMINLSSENTIDERALNKTKLNAFKITENQNLALNSASSIGCSVVNIGPGDLSSGKVHLVLGLLWQIIRIGLFANITLSKNPNIAALLRDGETLEDLFKLSPEELLLRWVNYQMERAGSDKRISNFSGDIKDSECYSILLKQIAPHEAGIDPPGSVTSSSDLTKRATMVLKNADKIHCKKFVTSKDIVMGNSKLNLAFVANLFNNYPALDPPEDGDFESYEETREEKTYRNWMNSLGVSPYVNYIYNDLSNGLVIFQLIDACKPGVVDWNKVNRPPFKALGGKMKKIENCNYAVELGSVLKFSLVGIGGEDLHNGNKTLVLALVWQLMRCYTLSILEKLSESGKSITDAAIVDWVNATLRSHSKSSTISSFKDPSISTSHPVLDLVDAISPRSVDQSLVTPGQTDEEKISNSQYAISMCRKIGAKIYALPEDIVDVNQKMILTIFACLMTRSFRR